MLDFVVKFSTLTVKKMQFGKVEPRLEQGIREAYEEEMKKEGKEKKKGRKSGKYH